MENECGPKPPWEASDYLFKGAGEKGRKCQTGSNSASQEKKKGKRKKSPDPVAVQTGIPKTAEITGTTAVLKTNSPGGG